MQSLLLGVVLREIKNNNYARRKFWQAIFGHGFDSRHLHQHNITQNHISMSAVSPLQYGLCRKTELAELFPVSALLNFIFNNDIY